ncbi:MAG: spore cortex biosynthesis protein YabQ [Clostridia bacterium]|nr:spore cortex biosynthesis protein YabQ [Clostridia bacterium]
MTQYLSQGSLLLLTLRAFLWGVMLGAVYSVFGIRRTAFHRLRIPRLIGALLLHIEDFLICITGAVGLSILYFATTQGVLRIMAIPMLGLGIYLWRFTCGRLIKICTDAILDLLAYLLRFIYRHLIAPVGRATHSVYLYLRDRLIARRRRCYSKKLTKMSHTVTLRYGVALSAACGRGTLPEKSLRRWQPCNRPLKLYRRTQRERNRPNEK